MSSEAAGPALFEMVVAKNIDGVQEICTLFKGNASVLDFSNVEMGGATSLVMACVEGPFEAATCLIEAGAALETQMPMPPIVLCAVLSGNFELVKLLVLKGAKVAVQGFNDFEGVTPLMMAVRGGASGKMPAADRKHLVRFLLDHGADKTPKDVHGGKTALEYAREARLDFQPVFDGEFMALLSDKDTSGVPILSVLLNESAAIWAPLVAMNKSSWDENGDSAITESEAAIGALLAWIEAGEDTSPIPGLPAQMNPRNLICATMAWRLGDGDDDYLCLLHNYVWADTAKFAAALSTLKKIMDLEQSMYEGFNEEEQRKVAGLARSRRLRGIEETDDSRFLENYLDLL